VTAGFLVHEHWHLRSDTWDAGGADTSSLRVAVIGTGNIGTDLMVKIRRSSLLDLVGVAQIDAGVDGMRWASSGSASR
jgi:predicted homoserine dehydrogenase-like protein